MDPGRSGNQHRRYPYAPCANLENAKKRPLLCRQFFAAAATAWRWKPSNICRGLMERRSLQRKSGENGLNNHPPSFPKKYCPLNSIRLALNVLLPWSSAAHLRAGGVALLRGRAKADTLCTALCRRSLRRALRRQSLGRVSIGKRDSKRIIRISLLGTVLTLQRWCVRICDLPSALRARFRPQRRNG